MKRIKEWIYRVWLKRMMERMNNEADYLDERAHQFSPNTAVHVRNAVESLRCAVDEMYSEEAR